MKGDNTSPRCRFAAPPGDSIMYRKRATRYGSSVLCADFSFAQLPALQSSCETPLCKQGWASHAGPSPVARAAPTVIP